MLDQAFLKSYGIPLWIACVVAIMLGIVILMFINTSLMRILVQNLNQHQKSGAIRLNEEAANPEMKYSAITERNLFRSKLKIELPKPKTDKEVEEENFISLLRTFGLKGVWIGNQKEDHFAFIDKGPQKGVWIHRNGEQMEGGLTLAEIRTNSIVITKGEFGATLTLFTKGFEKTDVKKNSDSSRKSTEKDSRKNNK